MHQILSSFASHKPYAHASSVCTQDLSRIIPADMSMLNTNILITAPVLCLGNAWEINSLPSDVDKFAN